MVYKQLFVSIGTRFAMERLLDAIDEISSRNAHYRVTAQIGDSNFQSRNMVTSKWLSARDFEKSAAACDVFISHAGMGNILLAAKLKKQIVIMPRQFDLNEHTNNHQVSTALAMAHKPYVRVANDVTQLDHAIIEALASTSNINDLNHTELESRSELIHTLKNFIDNG